MDATEQRAAQGPLKSQYRDDPQSAVTPVSARGRAGDKDVTFNVEQWSGKTRAGWHVAVGGDGTDACSANMLLEAVLGCAGVTLRSVAIASGVELRDITGEATATFDARGTLGIDRDVHVGIRDLKVVFDVDTDATDEKLSRLAELVERYCVVGQSLMAPPHFVVRRAS